MPTLELLEQAVTMSSPGVDAIGEACIEALVVLTSIGINDRDGGTL